MNEVNIVDPYVSRIDKLKKIRRLMLVDDEKSLLLLFELSMKKRGYYVLGEEQSGQDYKLLITASSGEEALNELGKLKKHDLLPHLILLDVKMPGMSGDKVCEKLKSDPAYSGVPIYFWTAKSEMDIEELVRNSRADGYFQKPIQDMEKFVKTIEENMGKYQ